jgi:hypothetical protein
MKENVWYIVTKESDDGTFEKGDHIKLDFGTIGCKEAQGWINAEDVPKAIKGMECVLDRKYYNSRIEQLKKEIEKIHKILNEENKI